jgi:hypothetical protein
MNKDERELARSCYGYGRWDARHWFIGLEEGQAPWENNDFTKRAEVFRELNKDGLCDCLKFHKKIEEHRWHEKNPTTGKVDLQSTWKYLILFLMAFQKKATDDESEETMRLRDDSQRDYQRNRWGMGCSDIGETCVIELSGLPANNSKVAKERPEETREQIEAIRPTRIERIKKRIFEHNPKFVVMYGMSAKEHWREIAGVGLQRDIPRRLGPTTFLLALHPTAHFKKGQKKDQYWIDLGTKLRAESDHS